MNLAIDPVNLTPSLTQTVLFLCVFVQVIWSKQREDQKRQKLFSVDMTQRKKTRICEAWEMSLPPAFVSLHLRLSVYKLARNALFIEQDWHLKFSRKNLFHS